MPVLVQGVEGHALDKVVRVVGGISAVYRADKSLRGKLLRGGVKAGKYVLSKALDVALQVV